MKNPIRCFQGNAQPGEPFWKLTNAAASESGQPEIELYGYISEYSWMGDEVTPELFKSDLHRLGQGGPVTMRINSGGGDVIAASVIRSIMLAYPGAITVQIDGLAASAAVLVALSGKTVKILDSAYMMIHDPSFSVLWASLDIDTLKSMVDQLTAIKDGIVSAYTGRTGMTSEKLSRMMSKETWMSAQDAVSFGFADELIGGKNADNKAGLKNAAVINALRDYRNLPDGLAVMLQSAQNQPEVNPGAGSDDQQRFASAMEQFRAEIKIIVGG